MDSKFWLCLFVTAVFHFVVVAPNQQKASQIKCPDHPSCRSTRGTADYEDCEDEYMDEGGYSYPRKIYYWSPTYSPPRPHYYASHPGHSTYQNYGHHSYGYSTPQGYGHYGHPNYGYGYGYHPQMHYK